MSTQTVTLEAPQESPEGSQAPLVFTDSAAAKVKTLIDEEGDDSLKLRVFISGGGCSGFQYGFTFDEGEGDGDHRKVGSGDPECRDRQQDADRAGEQHGRAQ